VGTISFQYFPQQRGGYDSIFLRCFVAVATGRYGSQLTKPEDRHICEKATVEKLDLWLKKLKLL